MEFHNMQISDHRYFEKVLKNLRQRLRLAEEAPVLDLKTNVLVEINHVGNDESRNSSWTKLR